MHRVYECETQKKGEALKLLEADPYADDSFARTGYKVKDGGALGEEKNKTYVYMSASEEFLKKADEKLKGVLHRCREDAEKRIAGKIKAEEESAESGLWSIFGE